MLSVYFRNSAIAARYRQADQRLERPKFHRLGSRLGLSELLERAFPDLFEQIHSRLADWPVFPAAGSALIRPPSSIA